jgi:hypothetical protein
MTPAEIIQKIVDLIHIAHNDGIQHKIIFEHDHPPSRHEFLFFIKPEITLKDDVIQLEAILAMLLARFSQFDLGIRDIRILGAGYLEQFDIIARHYGVINALSRKPLQHISAEGKQKFQSLFGVGPDQVETLGSLEFLERFPAFTPVSLDELCQKNENVKLAGGTYCAVITVQGKKVYVINGFHPLQLLHFTEKGRSIIAFTLAGDLDWSIARNNFIGKTNPADANAGSLRNELLVNKKKYGLSSVSSSRNGFHLSAGPVEGLVELIRYCSDYSNQNIRNLNEYVFGRELNKIFPEHVITKICDNSLVFHNDKKISVFDLTEEKNSDQAIELLKESRFD